MLNFQNKRKTKTAQFSQLELWLVTWWSQLFSVLLQEKSGNDVAFYFVHWFADLAGAEASPLTGCEKFVLKFPLHLWPIESAQLKRLGMVSICFNWRCSEAFQAHWCQIKACSKKEQHGKQSGHDILVRTLSHSSGLSPLFDQFWPRTCRNMSKARVEQLHWFFPSGLEARPSYGDGGGIVQLLAKSQSNDTPKTQDARSNGEKSKLLAYGSEFNRSWYSHPQYPSIFLCLVNNS